MSEQLNTMNEQLITAGEAAEVLNTTLEDIPSNKCITRAEFEQLAGIVELTVVPTPSDATVKLNGNVAKSIKVQKGTKVTIEVSKETYQTHTETVTVNENMTKILHFHKFQMAHIGLLMHQMVFISYQQMDLLMNVLHGRHLIIARQLE